MDKTWLINLFISSDKDLENVTNRDINKLISSALKITNVEFAVDMNILIDMPNLKRLINISLIPGKQNATISFENIKSSPDKLKLLNKIANYNTNEKYKYKVFINYGHCSGIASLHTKRIPITMKKFKQEFNTFYDVIIFDCCYMGNVYTIRHTRDIAKYLVASMEYLYWDGIIGGPRFLEYFVLSNKVLDPFKKLLNDYKSMNSLQNEPTSYTIVDMSYGKIIEKEVDKFIEKHGEKIHDFPIKESYLDLKYINSLQKYKRKIIKYYVSTYNDNSYGVIFHYNQLKN
jgi:hypothetical protein